MKQRILVVEDNPEYLELLVQILEDIYDLETAMTGIDAVARASARPPDLILMDLSLPELDGLAATRQLRGLAGTNSVPIIAVTGRAGKHDRQEALSAGCSAYIAKPIAEELLLDMIGTLLVPAP